MTASRLAPNAGSIRTEYIQYTLSAQGSAGGCVSPGMPARPVS